MLPFSKGFLSINASVYIVCAIVLFFLPVSWLFAWCIAVFLHELSHYIALRLLRIEIYRIEFNLSGAKMETEALGKRQELVAALAGPLGALCVVPFIRWFPRVGICAIIQSGYNLLPVMPLDGGRAVKCVCEKVFPRPYAQSFSRLVGNITILALLSGGLYVGVNLRMGCLPLFIVFILAYKHWNLKIPCKLRELIVQ